MGWIWVPTTGLLAGFYQTDVDCNDAHASVASYSTCFCMHQLSRPSQINHCLFKGGFYCSLQANGTSHALSPPRLTMVIAQLCCQTIMDTHDICGNGFSLEVVMRVYDDDNKKLWWRNGRQSTELWGRSRKGDQEKTGNQANWNKKVMARLQTEGETQQVKIRSKNIGKSTLETRGPSSYC